SARQTQAGADTSSRTRVHSRTISQKTGEASALDVVVPAPVTENVRTNYFASVIFDLVVRLGGGLRCEQTLARAKYVGHDSGSIDTERIGANGKFDRRGRIERRRCCRPTGY